MQQIADWLKQLGMSEYAKRFAENRVDFSVLRDLTDQDLKDLGVVLGDRRKMLRAIANLDGLEKSAPAVPATANTAPPPTPVVSTPTPAVAPPPISAATEATGERRYLTVMFCDLVGSTSISAQLDAEEWRDLVGAYLDAASAAVTEIGGHVAKKLGDGLMCLFGYPLAQENDDGFCWSAVSREASRRFPPTLQQSLTARLDRLGPAREVAQIGAVIGRGFSYALLRAVAGMEDTPLQGALEIGRASCRERVCLAV